MRYVFHPEAEIEFVKAVEYYEEREKGLGYDLAVEIYSTIERITCSAKGVANPETGHQEVFGPKVSVRNSVLRGDGWDLCACCDASASGA